MAEKLNRIQSQTKSKQVSYDGLLDVVQKVISNPSSATSESIAEAELAIKKLRFLRGGDR